VAREKALTICFHLRQPIDDRVDVECNALSFDDIQRAAETGDQSVAAPEADVLIVSAVRGDSLPGPFKAWIHGWLSGAALRNAALGALVGSSTPGDQPNTPVHRYLQDAADQAGIACFVGRFDLPRGTRLDDAESLLTRAVTVTNLLEEILHQPPPPRWGINE
jgi:hypothetical protein